MAGRQPTTTVFIGNISFDTVTQDIEQIFGAVGPIKSLRLVTDKETGKPKGFGFCEYHDQYAADSAVRNLNGHELHGRQLRVHYADEHMREGGDRGPRGGDRDRERRGPPMDRDRGPAPPPGAGKAVGAQAAAAAAATMSSWLGGPPTQGPVQGHVNNVLGGMSAVQLFDIMSQLRALISQNGAQARQTLISNPQLTKALFQAQIMLGMVKPPPPASAPAAVPAPVAAPLPSHLQQPPGPAVVIAGPGYAAPAPQPGTYQAPGGYSIQPGQVVVQIAQPQADAGAGGLQYTIVPQPMPQPAPPPAAPAPAALPTDQQALLAQITSMTQEAIDALPEETRMQVLQVKQLLQAQGLV